MNRHNDLPSYLCEQSIHTGVVIACFDAFCQTITQKTVVIMDNASIHTSEAFEHRLPYWKKQGLVIKYLSPYSPELNLMVAPQLTVVTSTIARSGVAVPVKDA